MKLLYTRKWRACLIRSVLSVVRSRPLQIFATCPRRSTVVAAETPSVKQENEFVKFIPPYRSIVSQPSWTFSNLCDYRNNSYRIFAILPISRDQTEDYARGVWKKCHQRGKVASTVSKIYINLFFFFFLPSFALSLLPIELLSIPLIATFEFSAQIIFSWSLKS